MCGGHRALPLTPTLSPRRAGRGSAPPPGDFPGAAPRRGDQRGADRTGGGGRIGDVVGKREDLSSTSPRSARGEVGVGAKRRLREIGRASCRERGKSEEDGVG